MVAVRDVHAHTSTRRHRGRRRAALTAFGAVLGGGGLIALAGPAAAADLPANCSQADTTVTCTYSFTGDEQEFTVPNGVTSLQLAAWGGHGAGSPPNSIDGVGGRGALATGTLDVTSGEALSVSVGGDGAGNAGGFGLGNGGSATFLYGYGGGGGTGVTLGDGTIVLVAAGGGGGAEAANCVLPSGGVPFAFGGDGGDAGQNGSLGDGCNFAAGDAGVAGGASGHDGGNSVAGDGRGGGGGGGYLGGTGGAGSFKNPAQTGYTGGSGGGGGTSHASAAVSDADLSGLSDRSLGQNGRLTIIYTAPDQTGPVDAPVATPAANASGWNNTDVSVAWNWTDADSGVDPAGCTQQSTSSGEGVQTLSASCSDLVGNTSSDSVGVKIDKTEPVDAPVVTTSSAGAAVDWNWSDVLSGVDASSCTQSSQQTGTGQLTFTASCTDLAGNTATDTQTVTVAPQPTRADVREKVTGPATGKKGRTYTYTVTTKNVGPATAVEVGTTMLLPRDASVVSVSGSYTKIGTLVVWKTTPSLASGASVTYTVKVKFNGKGNEPLAAGAASLRTHDPNLLNNASVVTTKIS